MMVEDLSKKELQEVIEIYIKEREGFPYLISFEEFLKDYIRRCESCDKLVFCEDELLLGSNWDGKKYHCCEECYQKMEEDNQINYDENTYTDEYEERLIRGEE